jgi:aspartate/methionine/tyrosine aminotransferase
VAQGGSFREVPYMGVIHVVAEAMKLGFRNGDPDWCNLGQGQPEVGSLPGAPPRVSDVTLQPSDHAYGHVNGLAELRAAVAAHYNRLFRRGRRSQYAAENVAIVSGGRLALSRIVAALGSVNVGYQTPDYTAYEDMLDYHRHRFTPVLAPTVADDGFRVPPDRFDAIVRIAGLGAYVVSNPCNPTGVVLAEPELERFVEACRRQDCLFIADEFYSHYVYDLGGLPVDRPVSSAAVVEDVERDPVLIVDGLTKNFRYPGWRMGWVVGPRNLIETIGRTASAIDGGPSTPAQRAAVEVLEPQRADQETTAVRTAFRRKRDLMRPRLEALGVRFATPGEGTFYLWGSIADLPAPFNDAEVLFRAALKARVMLVPGAFFDVNPGRLRRGRSPFSDWMRFSFGPPEENVALGLDRLATLIGAAAAPERRAPALAGS